MKQDTYQDKLILELRRKLRQEQPDTPVRERKGFKKRMLFNGACTIMLPEYMQDMAQRDRLTKYRSAMRPDVIITDGSADATFTFSIAGQDAETKDPEERMKSLRKDMQKVWKQAVFYDMGMIRAGEIPVPWMDCRTFCLNGSLYCLFFLFEIQGQLILGNFHCSFPQYDRWKPVVLEALETIETGGYHERLPNKD